MTDARVTAALEAIILGGVTELRRQVRAEIEAGEPPLAWHDLRHWRQEADPPEGVPVWVWDGRRMGLGLFRDLVLDLIWSDAPGMRASEVKAWAKFGMPEPPMEVT
jgi:hypothetical protein